MSSPPATDNPTRAHIAAAVEAGEAGAPLGANPALAALAPRLVRGRAGALEIRFTTPPDALQGNGVVGGGVLAGMLDAAMAIAVLSALPFGRTCATISLNVNMLAAARPGDLLAEAEVDRLGRSVAFVRASLFDAEHTRLVATASASFAIIEERPASVG